MRKRQTGVAMEAPTDDQSAKSPQLLAIRLIQDAESYAQCARFLDGARNAVPRFQMPTYFLLCQSIELMLKAYLAASGVSAKTLRDHRMRHNMELLFRYARRYFGLAPTDARFPDLVRWLSPLHLDHFFRYPKGSGLLQLPVVSESANIIIHTVAEVELHVRREFSKTRS
jgi:hypothetical protein